MVQLLNQIQPAAGSQRGVESMRIEKTFSVSQPPQRAFEYLANIEHEPRWNPWAIEVQKITPGPVGPGSRFRGRYKRFGVVEQELDDYQPPQRMTYRSNTMGSASMTFEFEPEASGTRVTVVGRADPPGLMKLIDPLMGLMMGRHFDDLVAGISRELSAVPA